MKRKIGELAQGGADKLLRMYECPICFDFMTAAIFQCGNGHLICEACKESVVKSNGGKCPSCLQVLGNTRNRALEELSAVVKLPCKNHSRGCTAEMFAHERDLHQSTCSMRPVECSVAYFKQEDLKLKEECSWTGLVADLAHHLMSTHKFKSRPFCLNQNVRVKFVVHAPPQSIYLAFTVLKADPTALTTSSQPQSRWWPEVLTPELSPFSCLQIRARLPDGGLKVFLRSLTTSWTETRAEYWYRLSVGSNNGALLAEFPLCPYNQAAEWELTTDQCLTLSKKQLDLFALPSETHQGESKLEICCQVIRVSSAKEVSAAESPHSSAPCPSPTSSPAGPSGTDSPVVLIVSPSSRPRGTLDVELTEVTDRPSSPPQLVGLRKGHYSVSSPHRDP